MDFNFQLHLYILFAIQIFRLQRSLLLLLLLLCRYVRVFLFARTLPTDQHTYTLRIAVHLHHLYLSPSTDFTDSSLFSLLFFNFLFSFYHFSLLLPLNQLHFNWKIIWFGRQKPREAIKYFFCSSVRYRASVLSLCITRLHSVIFLLPRSLWRTSDSVLPFRINSNIGVVVEIVKAEEERKKSQME